MKTIYKHLLLIATLICSSTIFAAIPEGIGSLFVTNQTMTAQGNKEEIKDYTIDYRVVTYNGITYARVETSNNQTPGGTTWEAQLRYWNAESEGGKTENNLTDYRANGLMIGHTANIPPTPCYLSIFLDVAGFSETAERIAYNPSIHNSANADDTTAPTFSSVTATPAQITADIVIEGASEACFYYIEDASNGLKQIAMAENFTLSVETGKTYNLSIYAIDFSGNISEAKTCTFSTGSMTHIVAGTAKDLNFKLLSSGQVLEVYVEVADNNKMLYNFGVKAKNSKNVEINRENLTVSPDRKYGYVRIDDGNLRDEIVTINLVYLLTEDGNPIWENYVVENSTITAGDNIGKPITHRIGSIITEDPAVVPTLTSVKLLEQTGEYVKLNLSGADNTNNVYYEITGGTQTVNAFRTGDYYFTNFDKGSIYTLNVKAKDWAGNVSTNTETVKFKTENKRSTFTPGQTGHFSNPNDQAINVTINYDADAKTLTWTLVPVDKNNTFYTARLERLPNGNKDFTIADDFQSATYTFNNVEIRDVFDTKLAWVWRNAEGNAGGTYWTNDFVYIVGDDGADDNAAPEPFELIGSIEKVSWSAVVDLISGVKYYEVYYDETTTPEATIYDLGESTFEYPLEENVNTVTVKAYDFYGNVTQAQFSKTNADTEAPIVTASVHKLFYNRIILNLSATDNKTENITNFTIIDGTKKYTIITENGKGILRDLTPGENYTLKVSATDAAGNISTEVEIDSFKVPEAINLVLDQTAEASSGNATFAIDNDNATRWESEHGVDPQWLIVDLGNIQEIHAVEFVWEGAYGKTFDVEVANTNTTDTEWTKIANVNGQVLEGFPYTQTLDVDANARYVRFFGTERGTGYGYSFWEMRVWGINTSGETVKLENTNTNKTFIYTSNSSIYFEKEGLAEIYTSTGIKITEINVNKQSQIMLPAGIYIVRLHNEKAILLEKVIVK